MQRKILALTTAALLAIVLAAFAGASAATAQEASGTAVTTEADKTRCLSTDQISDYNTESDKLVRFFMKNGEEMLLRLKHQCPQLHFHRYVSYTPVDGKLCAGNDKIKTRAGVDCRIFSISHARHPTGNEHQTPAAAPSSEVTSIAKPADNPQ